MERQCQDARQDDSSNGRQKGNNDTWRQKREARMAMTTTMITMTCVVRTIMAWLQRHDGDEDDSMIVTTGRWRRWLEHDVMTVTTTIAGPSRQDGDDNDKWYVTTGGWQLRRERVVSLAMTSWVQDQALVMSKVLDLDYSVQDGESNVIPVRFTRLDASSTPTSSKSLICSSIGKLYNCSVTTTVAKNVLGSKQDFTHVIAEIHADW